ncbi:hypothetical protein OAV03_01210 [bacterium]|nr:hypothetical protein [bacterium]
MANLIPAVILFVSVYSSVGTSFAGEKLTAYFYNDSVNGFQLSDAYETHNMGLRYLTDDYYAQLDLGIVSPDMWVYKNEYRVANRSFGEVITLELGQSVSIRSPIAYYFIVKSVGEFGIDKLQDFAHRILFLQPVKEINDIVRMPNATWFGVGSRYIKGMRLPLLGESVLGSDAYLGSDQSSFQFSISDTISKRGVTYGYSVGLKAVAYDEIVTAPPIAAELRHFIPHVSVGLKFEIFEFDVFVREILSLPTIASDNEIFAVLNAGISYKF